MMRCQRLTPRLARALPLAAFGVAISVAGCSTVTRPTADSTAVGAMSTGSASAAPAGSAGMGRADARHLLARAGFGPTLAEVESFARLTREQAVAQLLAAPRAEAVTPPPASMSEPMVAPRVLRKASVEQRMARQKEEMRRGFELRAWWISEMLATPSPLTERMTLFWHNHFTSSQQKVRYAQLMYQQNVLFRKHAMGNFGELLHAASRDPAMVIYLDSASNRRDRPNENFAREVMELFTLGEGNYSEADIREAARAFTGWSIDNETPAFRWRPFLHDAGEKTVLGRRGRFDGDAVLDILLEHPRTAQHIVAKLWREFVAPQIDTDADRAEAERIARAFRDSRYDIRVALRELLLSPAFWAADNRGALVKSPVDFVVGTLRQFDVRVADAMPFAFVTANLGQNLFSPPNVKGWPGGDAWINSGSLLARKQFVERLFRADEMRRPSSPVAMLAEQAPRDGLAAQQPGAAPGAALQARMRRAADETRFDGEGWFRQFNTMAAGPGSPAAGNSNARRTANGDARRDLDRFVLAAAPANPVPEAASGRERLRLLALDPAYQLK